MSIHINEAGRSGLSRRSFLKSAIASGAFGISGMSLLTAGARAAPAASREVLTGCHWGAFRAQVEDGRMVGVKPWESDPHPSAQLAGVLDSVYSPTRIKYPMVRRAYLEHGPGTDPDDRGSGDFVRVSWKQALDLVAGELQRVTKSYGPAAIFAGSYGWKSPGKLHNCQTLLRRMMTLNGGFVNTSGDYSTGAAQVIMPYVIGSIGVYEQPTAWPVVAANTELMVFWGADPINNCQISYQIADHGAYPGLEALKKSGKTVLCIDPLKTETCSFLNAEWLAPRPQTDVAMMLGIAHTLYAEKLHDEKFLAKYTTGFEQFLPYLTGKADGTPKSAEWASQICEIPAATIKDLARRFAKHRTMLACGYSLQRQHHGEQPHWMMRHTRMHARANRPAGRRVWPELPLCERRQPGCDRPGTVWHRRRQSIDGGRRLAVEERLRVDTRVAHGGDAAEPRQADRVQRHQRDLSGHQARILGRAAIRSRTSRTATRSQGVAQARDLHRA